MARAPSASAASNDNATRPQAPSPAPLPPLALTMGDPAGIGPDITLAAWRARNARALPPFAVLADADMFAARAAALGLDVPLARITSFSEAAAAFPERLPVLEIPCAAPVVAGRPEVANAPAVIGAIERAVAAVRSGEASAVVTNPIAKSVLAAGGFSHPGHTEFLGALAAETFCAADARPVMLLASDALNVVPLTVHIPLARVPAAISADLIVETARIVARAMQVDFGLPRPRIAVTGLNPHAGEAGTMGDEEERIIAPALARLRDEGMAVTGPHPADTLFHAAARKAYDVAIAMYHDQALIPIKTLAFDSGVNVTIGLPFVRTSPDHGTAFAIAGTGAARPESVIAALALAHRMALRRRAQTAAAS